MRQRTVPNIDLVLADNKLSTSTALDVADHLLAAKVDLIIEYQIDQQANDLIMPRFRNANIPVIAVDIPMLGATFLWCGQLPGRANGRSRARQVGTEELARPGGRSDHAGGAARRTGAGRHACAANSRACAASSVRFHRPG